MPEENATRYRHSDGLRMRFKPRSRIANPFLQIVPWLNIIVIIALFLVLAKRVTLQPGVVFNLPTGPFQEGLRQGLTLIMLHVKQGEGEARTFVFFDDVRYRPGDEREEEQLRQELRQAASRPGGRQALLFADRNVPHGDVMALVRVVRSAGIRTVNVALKPE